ncbi:polyphosphate polymerase domain-containing protein [Cryobacterium sp. PH29-G1]|uniref:polyphosphate polymerase domain-containing protein n=1 Tax=Cryobacterium sp. PH29-G1 TaxID=3046211 RepID=UPI0024B88A71|nr:polyphosphate polymerase domain-containing protein [Cryobacterium sp. PH29-G1]MDJ0349005.1 polyphosphate polymerase domain-containing protein [Cryobacterium sp. PH29-G1]
MTADTALDGTVVDDTQLVDTPLEVSLARLGTIGLAELTERASLLTRIDRKYVLPRSELHLVLRELDPGVRVLDIEGVRSSAYESVYFDTPELTSFMMAAHPRRRRFKIRTRTYVDSAQSYLEVKTRGGRGVTVKERLPYAIDDRSTLTSEGRRYTDSVLDEADITGTADQELAPTLLTRYLRTTLFIPESASRATIDTDLSWSALTEPARSGSAVPRYQTRQRRLDRPRLAIIETKSGSRASAVDRILWANGHRPATISKYGTGMAALYSDLPGNKWAPVLRRHFR